MADQKRIVLRSGHATPKNIVLYALPVADASTGTTIYLTEGQANAKDILLRNPASAPSAAPEVKEGSAPLSAVASVVVGGQKLADDAAPLSAVAEITVLGEVVDQVSALDPGTRGKVEKRNEYTPQPRKTQQEQVDEVVTLLGYRERAAAAKARRPAPVTSDDDDEEILWLIAV